MSCILSSQGMVVATAMAVSAGTVILLAYRRQKLPPSPLIRSCISSEGKEKTTTTKKKKKKKVHFAADVADPGGDGEEFRRKLKIRSRTATSGSSRNRRCCSSEASRSLEKIGGNKGMPENRAALYNGILRDRAVHHRLAAYYSC